MNILGDSDSEVELSINKDYAKNYERWRKGEELQKLKDKYGDVENSSSGSSSSEDEDAEELTEDVEKQFFKTLSCLKKKDSKIYDGNVKFFKESEGSAERKKKKTKKEQSLTVAEYQRKLIVEKGGKLSDDEFEEDKTFVQKEKDLKESFKKVVESEESENEKEWGSMFKKKVKSKKDEEKEENDYKEWLSGQKDKIKNKQDEQELKYLHDYWNDPGLDDGEKFLRDYILNKRFLEKDTGNNHVHDSDADFSADEDTINKQEDFERKYNFRFEEPDQEFIKRYPRTMDNLMRKKDDKRKKQREETKARKAAERVKKDEELKRLKALKRSEIMEKLKKLQDITGNTDTNFMNEDVEGDFDPEAHDKRMAELFSDGYYNEGGDEEKPEFPELDEELEIENWDEWDHRDDGAEAHCEDPDFNMDCDYDPTTAAKSLQAELADSTSRRKKRRQSKFAAAVAKKKPLFDPGDKTFEKYIDDYYSLDYEDLIGDIPCRFKYRKVVPNDFGLTVEEILSAPDKELNRWVSLKKIVQRRPENVEQYDVIAYKKKSKNLEKKMKILPSVFASPSDNTEEGTVKLKKKDMKKQAEQVEEITKGSKKTKKKKKQVVEDQISTIKEPSSEDQSGAVGKARKRKKKKFENKPPTEDSLLDGEPVKKKKIVKETSLQQEKQKTKVGTNKKFDQKKRKGKKIQKQEGDSEVGMTDARLKAYGLNPKKFKNKMKYGKSKA